MITAYRTFRRFARPYRGVLAVGALLALLEVVVRLAEPWPLRVVVDNVLASDPAPFLDLTDRRVILLIAVVALLAVVALAALLDYWAKRLLSGASLRIAADARGVVFSHLHRLSLGFHGKQRIGDLSTRVTGDVDRAQDMLVQALAVIAPNVMLVIGMFAVMLTMDPAFTVVAVMLTPVLALAVFHSTRQLKASSRRARKADGQVASAATESLGVVSLVQVFGLERRQRSQFDDLTSASLEAGLESVRLQARFSPMVDITSALSAAVVLWFGAGRVISGELSLGTLLVFVSYLGSLYKPLKALARVGTSFAKGAAASERVAEILAAVPDIDENREGLVPRRLRGGIQLEDVHVDYDGKPALCGVDLTVMPGETMALVGATGAGKSTLVALLPRLLDPTQGRVVIDGLDARAYQLDALRHQVSMVLQDCLLMRGTLEDNVRMGRPGASDADVRRACRLALVDEFADRLPDGLRTMVGERGASLSGGQRQRVAIARAILRDAPILILDEPTAALDTRSEEALLEAWAQLPEDRTTIVIAHRLSTVRSADRVAVLDRGRVVQLGAPEVLATESGPFRELARAGLHVVRNAEPVLPAAPEVPILRGALR